MVPQFFNFVTFLINRLTHGPAIFNTQPACKAQNPPLCCPTCFAELTGKDYPLKLRLRIIKFAFLSMLLVSGFSGVAAQSTIFNVPSTDVQAPGKVYLEGDFITHYASYRAGAYQTYGPRSVVGLPGKT